MAALNNGSVRQHPDNENNAWVWFSVRRPWALWDKGTLEEKYSGIKQPSLRFRFPLSGRPWPSMASHGQPWPTWPTWPAKAGLGHAQPRAWADESRHCSGTRCGNRVQTLFRSWKRGWNPSTVTQLDTKPDMETEPNHCLIPISVSSSETLLSFNSRFQLRNNVWVRLPLPLPLPKN